MAKKVDKPVETGEVKSAGKKSAEKPEKENLHEGHRKRLRQLLITNGPAAFPPHVLLEFLLGFSIKRQDTNPLAHRLLKEYGSLANVLTASYESLITVEGVGEQTALLLVTMGAIMNKSLAAPVRAKHIPHITETEKMGKFLVNYFKHKSSEMLIMIPCDSDGNPYDLVELGTGNDLSVCVPPPVILSTLIKYRAARYVLAHNHMGKTCKPSQDDLNFTGYISNSSAQILCQLEEHFIIAGDKFLPISRKYSIDTL